MKDEKKKNKQTQELQLILTELEWLDCKLKI